MKLWQVISGVAVVLALIGSFFVIESRWNQSGGVMAAEREIKTIRKETIQTFQQVRDQIKTTNNKLDKKFTFQINSMQYDTLTEQYYRLKREVKAIPSDRELREEFENVKRRRLESKKQMAESVK
jgi:TolA-binding protein